MNVWIGQQRRNIVNGYSVDYKYSYVSAADFWP